MAGVRESKRTATREKIAAAGLTLFLHQGYEETTIDGIAAASGISRRTFFYYFASKDDVLLAWHGAGAVSTRIGDAVRSRGIGASPLDTALECLTQLASEYETDESRAMDAFMQTAPALRDRKDAAEVRIERDLVVALTGLWPDPTREAEIRFAAMIAVGTLRISLEDWRKDGTDTLRNDLRRNAIFLRANVLHELS